MPEGISGNELDFYHFSEEDKEVAVDALFAEADKDVLADAELDLQVLSREWVDYNGKLCIFGVSKGHNSANDVDFFMGSLSFIYKGYFIFITYTKFDIDGTLILGDALKEIDSCLKTIHFDTVPSDKNAQLKSLFSVKMEALLRILLDVAIVAGVVILIIWLVKRKKKGLSLK